MPQLRLIEANGEAAVVDFGEIEVRARANGALRAEAQAIEAWRGKNAYSDFLLKHSRRPDPDEAATIGVLLNAQVKASDGSMQPCCSAIESAGLRDERKRCRSEARLDAQVLRLLHAIAALAKNTDTPSAVIERVCPYFDEPAIREHLSPAVKWLIRFEEEWHRREKGRRTA